MTRYSDFIMSAMASQITSVSIVYSTICSDADQRKHQNSASLAFVGGIHRWPVNSPHKGPVTRKMFPFDDVIMNNLYLCPYLWYILHILLLEGSNIPTTPLSRACHTNCTHVYVCIKYFPLKPNFGWQNINIAHICIFFQRVISPMGNLVTRLLWEISKLYRADLGVCPANERRCYFVQTWNQPYYIIRTNE